MKIAYYKGWDYVSTVHFYTKKNCTLCEEAQSLLRLLQADFDFNVEVRDIDTNDTWLEHYHIRIPVIEIGDVQIDCETMQYEQIKQFLENNLS